MSSVASSSSPRSGPSRRSTLEIEEAVDHSESPLLPTEVDLNPDPPLLVKLTGYRLLTIAVITSFGTAKAIMSLGGEAVTATWLDWVLGVVFCIVLYWLGLYESVQPRVAVWFFHTDLSLDLFYLSFSIILCSIYIVFAFFSGFFLTQLSVIAEFAIPFHEHVEEPWFSVLAPLFLMPLVIMLSLSMALSLVLPLLAGIAIAHIIKRILMLGGGRFKRKVIRFFVTGYRDRFDAYWAVYLIVTPVASFVIAYNIIMSFQLEQMLRKVQRAFE